MELIRFLFISILVLYIIRSLARMLLPMLFQQVVNKAQQGQQQNRRQKRPDGKVRVDFVPEKRRNAIPDSEGDVVDYEDVK